MALQGLLKYLGVYKTLLFSPLITAFLSVSQRASRKFIRYDLTPLIPPEVIESEILTRLPVKSLLRFKSVCKSWNLFITNPGFINKHHHVRNLNEDAVVIWSRFDYLLDRAYDYIHPKTTTILGCVNGLVCFCNDFDNHTQASEILIWNPATRQCLKIPPLPHESVADTSPAYLGFGYDSIANDFKVVYSSLHDNIEQQALVGCIYSCNSGCWTKIVPSNFLYNVGQVKVYHQSAIINRSPYWLVESVQSLVIISFHVQHEIFRLLPDLGSIDNITEKAFLMMNLQDSLAVMFCDKISVFNGQVDVCVYNEKCSIWNKTSTRAFIIKEPSTPGMQYHLVECFRNGDILFVSDDLKLSCINLESHTIKNLKTLGKEGYLCISSCYGGCQYSESLVFIEGMKSSHDKDDCDRIFFLTPFAPNIIRKESCPIRNKELEEEIEAAEKDVENSQEVEAHED